MTEQEKKKEVGSPQLLRLYFSILVLQEYRKLKKENEDLKKLLEDQQHQRKFRFSYFKSEIAFIA